MRFRRVDEVVSWRLCIGCGACKYICPEKNIALADIVNDGIRPIIGAINCQNCNRCMDVCPGLGTEHAGQEVPDDTRHLTQGWGMILEVWEGYAADPDIRYRGSSGGLATALALYCMEKEGMHGTVHIGADNRVPYKNRTVLSRTREGLLSRTGSRYSPASSCDSLDKIEHAPAPCVFIGKPCDVAGLRKAQALKLELDKKVGLAIGIFCAGTPSTRGTLELLKENNVNPADVEEIKYRGKGWPGKFAVRVKGEEYAREIMTYMDSWGFIQKYRPYRCYLCPDGTSEFADISCGDPWYRKIEENEQGYSLALVRTEKGRQIMQGAMKAGYVSLQRVDSKILVDSQKNLLLKRGAIWGRLITMKAFGIPTPRLEGFSLFKNWLTLPITEKARSILGTARRIIQRRYDKPLTSTGRQ